MESPPFFKCPDVGTCLQERSVAGEVGMPLVSGGDVKVEFGILMNEPNNQFHLSFM